MNNQRYLLVVSGPSGSGKDTVIRRLMEKHPEIEISVSATTRKMRPGEQEGVDYYYVSVPQFEKMIAENRVLEYTKYCENYYGTPRDEVESRLERKVTIVLVIEVEGGRNIKKLYPDCTSVFITPPSFEELEHRLRSRGTESEEAIQKRLCRAREELSCAADYDYRIVNDQLENCVDELYSILRSRQTE